MNYRIILSSNSPRRRELLAGLDIDFTVRVLPDIDESYPADLPVREIPIYISRKKAEAYRKTMAPDELVITADTVVVLGREVLGKPAGRDEAVAMLRKLSGQRHQVITGVCLSTCDRQHSFDQLLRRPLPTLRQGRGLWHSGMDRLYRCHVAGGQLFQCDGIARAAHLYRVAAFCKRNLLK